jgi:hypothetical protein
MRSTIGLVTLVGLVGLAGCFYSPGSFHGAVSPFAGKRMTLGCIDLAVTLTDTRALPARSSSTASATAACTPRPSICRPCAR